MNDLEMTKLCAEAMGYRQDRDGGFSRLQQGAGMDEPAWFQFIYTPLHNDAQAMALVKRFPLECLSAMTNYIRTSSGPSELVDRAINLNRAIVECVAKMQKAKA